MGVVMSHRAPDDAVFNIFNTQGFNQALGIKMPAADRDFAVFYQTRDIGGALAVSNKGEADVVCKIVNAIVGEGQVEGNLVGVISPYRAQVKLLTQQFSQFPWGKNTQSKVECNTIDRCVFFLS